MNPERERLQTRLRERIDMHSNLRSGSGLNVSRIRVRSVTQLRDLVKDRADRREKLELFAEAMGGQVITLRDEDTL